MHFFAGNDVRVDKVFGHPANKYHTSDLQVIFAANCCKPRIYVSISVEYPGQKEETFQFV